MARLPEGRGGGTEVVELVDADLEPQDGVRTMLVRVVATCTDCPPSTSWYAVQHAGDVLSTLGVAEAEDGEPRVAAVKPFAALAAQRLRAAA